ncbi:uncharacterized protein PHALS_10899 [Plasmopara halstedii]|uniref:RxLR-like protein n=1 Tax=Plasmopara halstedii TaxID=4781 RepID=A0A0N7L578_PLAHL|nr:uncharacterized protein PHALS_10899 [Plasmopara halstedii]CEG40715.1 hypothetical protein PHALS_10899 [Plasmopara halstedii]|eukprot:XP_024577084.1 hypothetical protein PHALS_10899 [Plasmopara halstedii]
MFRYLFPLLLSSETLALQPRDFRIPSIDFLQLSSTINNAHNFDLLDRFQENGIIALQNVPGFASLRHEYLRTAATCAVQAQEKGADFLLHRQLRDRTNRYTVSLDSGRQLTQSFNQSPELLALCPEFVELHAALSKVVELAVTNVGSALDATQTFKIQAEQGAVVMTARKLLEDSVHLDHFHAYEAPQSMKKIEDDLLLDLNDLSLELHTDNGVMIAMTAPEYFQVSSTGIVELKNTSKEDSGLFIQTGNGEIVRPVLYPDELILMLGSGIEHWIKTSPPLHSVLHGMRYPRSVSLSEGDHSTKILRSWFGKMILLDSDQQMDNSGLTFRQYANQTTRYLLQQGTEESELFSTVACPGHRRLVASANSCAPKVCSLKSTASSSDLESSCQITCNHAAPKDVALCDQFCDCQASTSTGTTCWMLCVENIATDVCPGEQKCNSGPKKEDLAMTCVGGTTPPSTTPPSTPVASTTTPSSVPSSETIPSTTSQEPSSSETNPSPEAAPVDVTETDTTEMETGSTAESELSDLKTTETGTSESEFSDLKATETESSDLKLDLGSTDLDPESIESDTPESATSEPVASNSSTTMDSNIVSSASNAGPTTSPTTVGDDFSTEESSTADQTSDSSSTVPSSSASDSSSASIILSSNSFYVVAAVATYICIHYG